MFSLQSRRLNICCSTATLVYANKECSQSSTKSCAKEQDDADAAHLSCCSCMCKVPRSRKAPLMLQVRCKPSTGVTQTAHLILTSRRDGGAFAATLVFRLVSTVRTWFA